MDVRLRDLHRTWKRTKNDADGWAYFRARVQAEDVIQRLVLEAVRTWLRGNGCAREPNAQDAIDWLDGRSPYEDDPTPEEQIAHQVAEIARIMRSDENRGFNRLWLGVQCAGCGHPRAMHERMPSEVRGRCRSRVPNPGCDCTLFHEPTPRQS